MWPGLMFHLLRGWATGARIGSLSTWNIPTRATAGAVALLSQASTKLLSVNAETFGLAKLLNQEIYVGLGQRLTRESLLLISEVDGGDKPLCQVEDLGSVRGECFVELLQRRMELG